MDTKDTDNKNYVEDFKNTWQLKISRYQVYFKDFYTKTEKSYTTIAFLV